MGGKGRIWAGRVTCLGAVLLGPLDPDGEVMLPPHPRLLLAELDLPPVLVDRPFAHKFALRSGARRGTSVYLSRLSALAVYVF